MLSGGASSSISRKTRSVSSLVLPVPALAETNTEAAGSDAAACRLEASTTPTGQTLAMRRRQLDRTSVHTGQRRAILGDTPFIYPRQMS